MHERTSIICVTDQAFGSAREHGPGFRDTCRSRRWPNSCARVAPASHGRIYLMRSSITDRVATLTVRRRCLVCEWLGTVEELETTDEIGPECSRCHAPTERIEVMSRSFGSRNPHAAALGRLGGLKGGRARAAALSPGRRRAIAQAAARARWSHKRDVK